MFINRYLAEIASHMPMAIGKRIYRMSGIKIGRNTNISKGFWTDRPSGVIIGNNVFINHHVHFHCGGGDETIIIKDNVFIAPEVVLIVPSHDIGLRNQRAGKCTYGSITIEEGAWIGANTTILPGVTIAKGCVIGAGSVVTKSTAPNSLYVGVPAHFIKELD